MISIATSIAALAWTPALAEPPLSGNTAPTLTVFSCEKALPAGKTEIEAAQSNPRIFLKFMCDRLREVPPDARLLRPGCARHLPPAPLFSWPFQHCMPVWQGQVCGLDGQSEDSVSMAFFCKSTADAHLPQIEPRHTSAISATVMNQDTD